MAAPRKTSSKPKPTTEDIYDVLLVPGVRVKFYRASEISPRKSREMDILRTYLLPKLRALYEAQYVLVAGEEIDESILLGGLPVGLSMDETRQLFELNDITAFAHLKSWTLRRGGEIAPLPKTIDELQDLPKDVYEALLTASAKIAAKRIENDFSVDAVEDPDSPTGA